MQLHFSEVSRMQAITLQTDLLNSGSNAGELLGMSGCLRKPLVATSGVDRILRLWNFKDR